MKSKEQIEEKLYRCEAEAYRVIPNYALREIFKVWVDALEWVLDKDDKGEYES